MSASLSVQSLRDPLGGLEALHPYGADRVRRLDLRQRSDGALSKARPAKGLPAGMGPTGAAANVATDEAALDSDYAACVRGHLRSHVASCQEWVVGAVRTMRRSVRRELDEIGGDAELERGLVAAMTPLLQQICDERMWQQRESKCVAAITQVRIRQQHLHQGVAVSTNARGWGIAEALVAHNVMCVLLFVAGA